LRRHAARPVPHRVGHRRGALLRAWRRPLSHGDLGSPGAAGLSRGMPLSSSERERLIERYAAGPARLRAAFAAVPDPVRRWRPAHEVVCHCADSETNASLRIRYLVAEREPLIVGYDQELWARLFDYHARPVETAMATVEAVRANTVPVLRALPEGAWHKAGRH